MPIIKNNDYWNGFVVGMISDWVNALNSDCLCANAKLYSGFMNTLVRESVPKDFVISKDLFIAAMEEWAGEVVEIKIENENYYIAIGDYELAEQYIEEGNGDDWLHCATYSETKIDYEEIKAREILGVKTPIAPKPEPKPEPVVEEKPDMVKRLIIDGKKYLVSRNTQKVYDYDEYVKNGEIVVLGTYNGTTIDFI